MENHCTLSYIWAGYTTYHVRIVLVEAHVVERVQSSHGPKSKMTVQLSQRIVDVLPGLHRWEWLRC